MPVFIASTNFLYVLCTTGSHMVHEQVLAFGKIEVSGLCKNSKKAPCGYAAGMEFSPVAKAKMFFNSTPLSLPEAVHIQNNTCNHLITVPLLNFWTRRCLLYSVLFMCYFTTDEKKRVSSCWGGRPFGHNRQKIWTLTFNVRSTNFWGNRLLISRGSVATYFRCRGQCYMAFVFIASAAVKERWRHGNFWPSSRYL